MLNLNELLEGFKSTDNKSNIVLDHLHRMNERNLFINYRDVTEYVATNLKRDIRKMEWNSYSDQGLFPFLSENGEYSNNYFKTVGFNNTFNFEYNCVLCMEQYKKDKINLIIEELDTFLNKSEPLKDEGSFIFDLKGKEYSIEYTFALDKIFYIIYDVDSNYNKFICEFYYDDEDTKTERDLLLGVKYSMNKVWGV